MLIHVMRLLRQGSVLQAMTQVRPANSNFNLTDTLQRRKPHVFFVDFRFFLGSVLTCKHYFGIKLRRHVVDHSEADARSI